MQPWVKIVFTPETFIWKTVQQFSLKLFMLNEKQKPQKTNRWMNRNKLKKGEKNMKIKDKNLWNDVLTGWFDC